MHDVSDATSESHSEEHLEVETTDAYQEALEESRRVVDAQVQMAENSDGEILTVLRITLLALGGVVTLLAYTPAIVQDSLPWVLLSGVFFISANLPATYIYRGLTLYAGFGDHGYDQNVPENKLRYSYFGTPNQNVSHQSFCADLLEEHKAGINHNNVEIKYRCQIHQQSAVLLVIGVITLGVGFALALISDFGIVLRGVVWSITAVLIAYGIYTMIKSIGLLYRYTQASADPERLTYGYAFERKYPFLSRVCSFVVTYLYDPAEGKW